ncbi:MAG: hypothetical protein ABIC57_00195 [bacterium]
MKIQGEFRTRKDYIGFIFYHENADVLVMDEAQCYVVNLMKSDIDREKLILEVEKKFPKVDAEGVVDHVIDTMSNIGLLSL